MIKKKSILKLARERAESAIKKTNEKITELGSFTSLLYDQLNSIQELFDEIRNVPSEKQIKYEELKKIRLNWKQQVEKIDSDYKNTATINAGKGAAGVGAGVAVAALGPTAAMGIATTFGVASTGTAISTLSGAAATNAALAWLGGGALATGGGGMVAGNALLALAGPIGWTIAGVAVVGSGLMLWIGKCKQNRLENIFTLISKRDVKSYELAIVEINERIHRIKAESQKLNRAIETTRGFGLDYNLMTEAKQYELGAYVNLMNSSTQLLVNPITGLKPKYDIDNLNEYIAFRKKKLNDNQKSLIVSFSNLLYKINLDDKDLKIFWKLFRRDKKFLSSIEMSKKDFGFSIFESVNDALKHKYRLEKDDMI